MASIILLATPVVVTLITQIIKNFDSLYFSERKVAILRIVGVTLSFIGSVMASLVAGEEVPTAQISTYVEALMLFASTQIPYYFGKMKGKGY